jgi:hypothetical protein
MLRVPGCFCCGRLKTLFPAADLIYEAGGNPDCRGRKFFSGNVAWSWPESFSKRIKFKITGIICPKR